MASKLTDEEIALCRKAFAQFDKDGSGTIDVKELKTALESMGHSPSDEELFAIVHEVDADNSGEIEFVEFMAVILKHKQLHNQSQDEAETLASFVALGGNPDKTGKISAERLRATIKAFELTLDIDRLIKEVDYDRSGFLDYKEYKSIMT